MENRECGTALRPEALKGFSQMCRSWNSFISLIHFANRRLSDGAYTPKQ